MFAGARRWFTRAMERKQNERPAALHADGSSGGTNTSIDESIESAGNLISKGEVGPAQRLLEIIARESPRAIDRAAANSMPANLLQDAGEHAQARVAVERALGDAPDDADLNYRAGVHALAAGEAELALDYFRLCRYYDHSNFAACAGEVKALQALARDSACGELLSTFLASCPGHRPAMLELAIWHYRHGEFDEALMLLEPLAEESPSDPEACNLLGLILGRGLGRIDEAIKIFERALSIRPGWTVSLCNLGWMLSEAGRHAQGLEIINDVLLSTPGDSEARLIRAYMNLKHGKFSNGWRDYDARHESGMAVSRPYHFPRWNGECGHGATLLIYAEQGLGDQLMFSSCVLEAAARVGRVFLECHPNLVSLFSRSFPSVSVAAQVPPGAEPSWLETAGRIDYQIAMGDLPALFRNDWSDFPERPGYLKADPGRIGYWRTRLEAMGPGIKVGLSWRGGIKATRRQLRSFAPATFSPLFRDGFQFVSLQYGDVAEDLAEMAQTGLDIAHWPEAIADYDNTAALICALNQVVSVCTAVIHLCGALGRPALVLVPKVAEWRYLYDGEKMPWYPSVNLIRQRRVGEWEDVLTEAGRQLART